MTVHIHFTIGIVSPPSTPQLTSIALLSANSLRISWESSAARDTVDRFRIEATYIGPCTNGAGDKISTEINGNTCQHNLTNLRTYSTYSVTVIAINSAGETSGEEEQVATLPTGMLLSWMHGLCMM